jgi:glycosyltransferase involved in cell wall biosynthesis
MEVVKIRILQVIDRFGLEYGGSSEVCYQISRTLVKRGHDVRLYARHIGAEHHIDGYKLLNKYPLDWIPDIIHIHNYRNIANITAWNYAKKHSIPYVLQPHGSLMTFFQKGLLKRVFDFGVGNEILSNCQHIIALSTEEINQCVKMGIPLNKVILTPNGINHTQYDNLPDKGRFRKRWGIKEDEKIILYLGRIHWMKGLDLLIKSFTTLDIKAKLVIAGMDDGYLSKCQKLVNELSIKDSVIFTGALYGDKKLEALADADLFILLSSYEIFSIAVIEASACGIPIIVSKNCGNVGWMPSVYPVSRNITEVSDTICKVLMDDSQDRIELGKNNAKQFTWDYVAQLLENNVYNTIDSRRVI